MAQQHKATQGQYETSTYLSQVRGGGRGARGGQEHYETSTCLSQVWRAGAVRDSRLSAHQQHPTPYYIATRGTDVWVTKLVPVTKLVSVAMLVPGSKLIWVSMLLPVTNPAHTTV